MRSMSIALIALSILTSTRARGQTPITEATISPRPPLEVVDGNGNDLPVSVPNLPLDFFNDYSWRLFVALNWPAKEDAGRGVADEAKNIGDSGRRVWETWKAGYEIIPKSATLADAPTPWSSFDAKTPCPELDVPAAGSGKKRILGVWKPFGDFHQAGFGTFDESNPLVDQKRKYLRYEVRVNEREYEHIRGNKLYLRSKIAALNEPATFPPNSIEVKAAWRELGGDIPEDEVKTFYTIRALVHDAATNTCDEKHLALVGFHIVQKTPLRPQWTWSSFEHVRNAPLKGENPLATSSFSLNDPTKPQKTDDPPLTITPTNPPQANPSPVQVVRDLPLHPPAAGNIGTEAMNQRYQAKLAGTVWANYRLVMTQWPTKTSDPAAVPPENIPGDPFPPDFGSTTSVANVALETYHQDASCMACHESARAANLDFVFFLDFHAVNDTGFDGAKPRTLDLLKKAIGESKRRASSN